MGFVLYASSASPIIKPTATEMKVPSVCKSLKRLVSSKKIEKHVDEIRNEMYSVIPPRAGLATLLHRITGWSLFLMPRFVANFSIIVLSKTLKSTMLTKNDE